MEKEISKADKFYYLAICYFLVDGQEDFKKEAAKWLIVAINLGHYRAVRMLEYIRDTSSLPPEDAYLLGKSLYEGQIIKSSPEAFKWFVNAAVRGCAEAQHALGLFYSRGDVIVKNENEAFKWFTRGGRARPSRITV